MNWGLSQQIAFDGTRTPLKTALFLLVRIAWLIPGLVGHDPWKYDEAVVFGIVNEMLRSGDWLTFRLAGEPYFDKAPLFLWVSAACARLFGGMLSPPDAARWPAIWSQPCSTSSFGSLRKTASRHCRSIAISPR